MGVKARRGLAVSIALGITFAIGAIASAQDGGVTSESVAAATSGPKATNGSVKCTAAINADGSVLSCKGCVPANATHPGTGEYAVEFKAPCTNILAVNGWSRWVQPDSLSTGTVGAAVCTTADRGGDANAVFVTCYDPASENPLDTSFFLFVAK